MDEDGADGLGFRQLEAGDFFADLADHFGADVAAEFHFSDLDGLPGADEQVEKQSRTIFVSRLTSSGRRCRRIASSNGAQASCLFSSSSIPNPILLFRATPLPRLLVRMITDSRKLHFRP